MNTSVLMLRKALFPTLSHPFLRITPALLRQHTPNSTATNAQNITDYEPDKLYSSVELEMRGHDPAVLKSYAWFLQSAADKLELNVTKNCAARKAEKERLTLLQCVHIYKKHRVQYEMRTYFRYFNLRNLTGSTTDTYLEYIERNLPEGVALKVTKVEIQELPEHILEKPDELSGNTQS